jgi:hypothetical protein
MDASLTIAGAEYIVGYAYKITAEAVPEQGPSYASGGEPASPMEYEVTFVDLRKDEGGGKETPVGWRNRIWSDPMNEHTPTPWLREDCTVYSLNRFDANRFNCTVQPGFDEYDQRASAAECEANAALIVKAVNAHDDLVIALTEISCTFDGSWRVGSLERSVGDKARAALSKIGD